MTGSSLHKKGSFPLRISSVNVDLVTLAEEILNGNFIFCAVVLPVVEAGYQYTEKEITFQNLIA